MKNKVKLNLFNLDGNAFVIMGAFQTAAQKSGWNKEEIKAVLDEAMNGDYDHLLDTILSNCETECLETYPEEWEEYDNYDNNVYFDDEF